MPRPLDSSHFAFGMIAPGTISSVSPVDVKIFHASHEHIHEKALHSTTKQLGIVLEGNLEEHERCSVTKGLGKLIGRTTSTRVEKIFGRLFVDVGKKVVASIRSLTQMIFLTVVGRQGAGRNPLSRRSCTIS